MSSKVASNTNTLLPIDFYQDYSQEINCPTVDDKQQTLETVAERVSSLYGDLLTEEGRKNDTYYTFGFLPKSFPRPEEVVRFKKIFKEVIISNFYQQEKYLARYSLKIDVNLTIAHKNLTETDLLEQALKRANLGDNGGYSYELYFPERGVTTIQWNEAKRILNISMRNPK